MDPNEERIEELRNILREERKKYYEGETTLSDAQFDALEEELRNLSPNDEYFKEVGAPVDTVDKIAHDIPMKSLHKVKTLEKLTHWINRRLTGGIDVIIQPKIDGVSLTNKYYNGGLIYSATRGDGFIGKDVTYIANYIKDIPKNVPILEEFEIRGEVYLPRDTEYAKERETKSLRNIAAGMLNRKDGREDAQYLKFVAYNIMGLPMKTEIEKMELLQEITPNPIIYEQATSIEHIAGIYEEYIESKRESLNYDIDGLVIKINDMKLQDYLDEGHPHHPGGVIAWKFPPQKDQTVLTKIEWTVGEKGKVTPVGYFEPVIIGGRTITKATLHNQQRIDKLQLEIGDIIEVSLMGDVIPGITANISKGISL